MRNALYPMARRCLPWLLACITVPALAADDFLPVKAAYRVATSVEAGRVVVRYEIADGYYLYRNRLGFETTTPGVKLKTPALRSASTMRTSISASR
jgi:thiol:disulfide interchange protein DsbD